MAQSSIEWTMKVWNPTTGCNKVSPGCKNCYAEIMHRRLHSMHPQKYAHDFLEGAFEHEPSLEIPLKWKKPATIFVNSMSDLFHKNISDEYIAKVYAVMFLTNRHTYQILTKRPERRLELFKSDEFFEYLLKYCNQYNNKFIKQTTDEFHIDDIKSLFPFSNIWEGTSTENQEAANERIPTLLQTPAAIRWISAEPLLGPIDLSIMPELCSADVTHRTKSTELDWVVVGGESGNKKRSFNSDWARQIRDYCEDAGVKFFMKQIDKVQEIPEDLLIREYPHLSSNVHRVV
jgi:protein gp37